VEKVIRVFNKQTRIWEVIETDYNHVLATFEMGVDALNLVHYINDLHGEHEAIEDNLRETIDALNITWEDISLGVNEVIFNLRQKALDNLDSID
jgi:hypothetical protein